MKTIESILRCESTASTRASERTAPPRMDGRATDVEIVHLQKIAYDLRIGMRNLRELRPAPFDLQERILRQAGKINGVENKLFKLRQTRLL